MNVKPLGNWVLLKLLIDEVSEGGIVLPKTAKPTLLKCKVLDVGEGETVISNEGIQKMPIRVKIDDIVILRKPENGLVTIDKDHILLMDSDIVAIVYPKENKKLETDPDILKYYEKYNNLKEGKVINGKDY